MPRVSGLRMQSLLLTGRNRSDLKHRNRMAQKSGPDASSKDALAMIKEAGGMAGKAAGSKASLAEKTTADATADKALQENSNSDQNKDQTPNLWDKFAGIFKVDPGKNDGSNSAASAGNDNTRLAAASRSFAFDSLSFKANEDGGALELTGYAEPGSRIRLYKGNRELGEAVANADGLWSFTRKGKVRAGRHLFRAAHLMKSGSVSSEARMQYDHVIPIHKAGQQDPVETAAANDNSKTAKGRKQSSTITEPGKMVVAATVADKNVRHKAARPSKSDTLSKRKRRAQSVAKKSAYKRSAKSRYSKRKRAASARRSARKKSAARYYLSKKNKARYLARRKLYPRSRKTPTKVRVRKGTTLWGYSQHYYGQGKLYRHIQRANRRKLKNPNHLLPGQKIYVPRLRKKRLKRR